MTFTSNSLLTALDYQQLTFTPGTPDSGEYLATAAPKIANNFVALFASSILNPQRLFWAWRTGNTHAMYSVPSSVNTVSGTGTSGSYSRGNYTDQLSRRLALWYDTGSTAASGAGVRVGTSTDYGVRGSATGVGGFVAKFRVALDTVPNNLYRLFAGLVASDTPGNVDPSAFVNCCGFGKDSADTQFYFMYNDGSGTCTKVALDPAIIPLTARTMYEIVIACAPGSNQDISYRIRTITGTDDEGVDTFGTAITGQVGSGTGLNLPAADTTLSALAYIHNAAQATAYRMALLSASGIRL